MPDSAKLIFAIPRFGILPDRGIVLYKENNRCHFMDIDKPLKASILYTIGLTEKAGGKPACAGVHEKIQFVAIFWDLTRASRTYEGESMQELLRTLVSIPGACGFEHEVIRYLYNRLKAKADEIWVDGLGNLIARKDGAMPGPTLMLSAHADEVGFIVKKIEPNGLIRFEKVGGHDDRTILNEHVIITTQDGRQRDGVIGCISCHMLRFDDPKFVRKHSDMYIDVGAKDAQGVARMGIQVADPITWATPYREFGEERAMGHGFDDRAGCAVLASCLETLDFSKVRGTVYFVFSTQEELGLRGARVASQQITADVAIAVDTTAVSDTFEQMMDGTLSLGGGVGIKAMDHSLLASVHVRRKLTALAKESGIPHQIEVFCGIGTDAGEMHKEKAGVPTCTLSIPSRSAHCPYEIIDLGDLKATRALLDRFILSMEDKGECRQTRDSSVKETGGIHRDNAG